MRQYELTAQLTITHTPGHTPGSISMIIDSCSEKAYIMGDVFHGQAQVTESDWVFRFDTDSSQAAQTRRNMLDRAQHDNAAIAICHHSGFVRVIMERGRRYWQEF